MKTPCVRDEGLYSYVPDTGIRMTTFVEAYHRVGGDLDELQKDFLEPAQFHAAMAFYCANKEIFDAEYQRIMEERRRNFEEFRERNKDKRGWAEFTEPIRGEETDEEVNAILEEMS